MVDCNSLERRCPRLGGSVTFGYCRTGDGSGSDPCFKILDCWWERFDVVALLREEMDPERFAALLEHQAPPPKVASLVDLIAKAQRRIQKDS